LFNEIIDAKFTHTRKSINIWMLNL
jgi:hypothetical protein